MLMYRGTQRKAVEGIHKMSSWTDSRAVATIYASHPEYGAVDDSTLHSVVLPEGLKVLDVRALGTVASLGSLLRAMGYSESDVDEDVAMQTLIRRVAVYLHKRLMGSAAGGPLYMALYDAEGDDDEIVVRGDTNEAPYEMGVFDTIPRYWATFEFDIDPWLSTTDTLAGDVYAFFDAPAMVELLRRKGWDGVWHMDTFKGGTAAAERLWQIENVYALEGVTEGRDYDRTRVPVHATFRPVNLPSDIVSVTAF